MSEFDRMEKQYIPEPEDRQNEVKRTRNNREFYKEAEEKIILPWAVYNSSLIEGKHSYQETFRRVVPKQYENIRDDIESTLEAKRGKTIGLDVGGLGSSVFRDFTPGFFSRTLGVTLRDTRKKYRIDVNQDTQRNHSVIEGDLLENKTRKEIARWLNDEKVDLILERMEGGLSLLPRDIRFFNAAIRELYELLSDNGIMYLQLTFEEKNIFVTPQEIQNWVNELREKYPSLLEIVYDESSIRIHKLNNAPEVLPQIRQQ